MPYINADNFGGGAAQSWLVVVHGHANKPLGQHRKCQSYVKSSVHWFMFIRPYLSCKSPVLSHFHFLILSHSFVFQNNVYVVDDSRVHVTGIGVYELVHRTSIGGRFHISWTWMYKPPEELNLGLARCRQMSTRRWLRSIPCVLLFELRWMLLLIDSLGQAKTLFPTRSHSYGKALKEVKAAIAYIKDSR